MTYVHPDWIEHQRKRFMRHDAHRYICHDVERFFLHGACPEELKPRYRKRLADADLPTSEDLSAELESERLALRHEIAKLRLDWELLKFALRGQKAFHPNQPRVPAGNPDGGQWTDGENTTRVRLAAADKPSLGPAARAAIAADLAKRLIDAYRSENFLRDLFGGRTGTVTVTTINGERVFGSNSTSPTYRDVDYAAAEQMRATLIEKYPDVMRTDNIGGRPNDALFHAEATILLRAARANGGTLAGQTLEVFSDRPMCRSCTTVLPYLGREIGNPTITFIDLMGTRRTMRDGAWLRGTTQ